jgi:ribonuclease R
MPALEQASATLVGVYRPSPCGRRRPSAGWIQPADRRARAEWVVPNGEDGGAEAGEVVLAAPLPHAGAGLRPARVLSRLGRMDDAGAISLISMHAHALPHEFPASALAEAARARALSLAGREDLRALPLVTIDGEDARDFDDAVYAELAGDGFRLIVAIADVAHYVRPGSALDREAGERGNSVYFPDRVVPMLPEALSNGWCSLRPGEDRGCLFEDMHVSAEGRKLAHRFGRGLMRSAARLTYEEAQQGLDCDAGIAGLPDGLLGNLQAAFRALQGARAARGALDLDLPERRLLLDGRGGVAGVTARPRLDSHRLIEEFMVLANIAAAEELERRGAACMYRVHAPPTPEKLDALRAFLRGFGLAGPAGNGVQPRDFARLIDSVAGAPHAGLVNEAVLRSQSQAEYDAGNCGHFGLALPRYAHFTSPIRRYADLLVHRTLIRALGLGEGGLADGEAGRFAATARHITATERRAAMAERAALDRFLALYLARRLGEVFAARISGVTRFGLFVTLHETGASGLVPLSVLPGDSWTYNESARLLAGRRSRLSFRLGQEVEVRLAEANPTTGGLVFHIVQTTGEGLQRTRCGARNAGRRSRRRCFAPA